MKHLGNKQKTHLALALFLLAVTLSSLEANIMQCQASSAAQSAFFKRKNAAAAFIVPSSSIPSSTIARRRHDLRAASTSTSSSLPMTLLLDSSSSPITSSTLEQQSTQLLLSDYSTITTQPQLTENTQLPPIEQLSPTTTLIVFIIGIIPFIWATIEFWRRIAVGASFGTGKDSVVIPSPFDDEQEELITIGEDGNPASSRGRRTLDKGALTVAYVLFGVAAFSVGIAVASVVMGPREMPPL